MSGRNIMLFFFRSVVPDYSMFDADFDDADDAMMYDDGPVKFENEPIVNIKEEPMDHDLGNLPLPPELANQGNGVKGKSLYKKEGLYWACLRLVVVAGKPVRSFFT